MEKTEYFTLSNGARIPSIGFGTWQIPNGKVAYESTLFALKSGYRHIDTANAYGNEESIGRAVRDSGIDRSEIFVTSKLPAETKTYEGALKKSEETMKNIGLDYIDLYLIHAPWPWSDMGKDYTKENIKVWKAMEEFYGSGRTRAIGISNFNVSDMDAILGNCSICPVVNQIKLHIGHNQEETTEHCRKNNILVEGYSPLATGRILGNKAIEEMSRKYDRTISQICIRYVLQRGAVPLPKSTHEEFILQNADVDFIISDDDMNYLAGLKGTVKAW